MSAQLRSRHRSIVEEDVAAPMDLRLLGPALGVWAGCLMVLAGAAAPWWLLLAVAATGAGLVLRPGSSVGCAVGAVLICLAAGGAVTGLAVHQAVSDPLYREALAGQRVQVTAVVVGDPQRSAASDRWPDDPARARPAQGRFLVRAVAETFVVGGRQYGSRAAVTVFATGDDWGVLIPGQRFTVTGIAQPDDFDPIPAVGLRTGSAPELTGDPPGWQRATVHLRNRLVQAGSGLGGDAAGLLPGIIVGDKNQLDPELVADAKTSGLAHLLAVSGSHFAVLATAVLVLLRRFGPHWAAAGGLLTVAVLVAVVRPEASVLRAAVMAMIAVLALLIGRTRTAFPALAAGVIGLLLWDPALAATIGFALSVVATAALVLVAPAWSKSLQRRGVPPGWADMLVVPVVAHLATMPVIASLSGAISVVSVPANILVLPVVAPVLVIGALAAVLSVVWFDAALFLATLIGPMLRWIALVAHWTADWPYSSLPWPASPGGVLTLALLVLVASYLLRGRRMRAMLAAVLVGVVAVLVPAEILSVSWPPPGWLLVGCEVGQGDAMVLSTGIRGEAVVVDTGPDPGQVDDCLDRLDIDTVPLLVLTHLHADHVDGLPGVLDGRSVAAIGVGPGREPAVAWRTVLATAASSGVPVIALGFGRTLTVGEALVEVIGPVPVPAQPFWEPNDQSVVLRATVHGVRILMTGDVEDAAQQALLASGTDLSADVLKEPHHGSATLLPAFVQAVQARVSVIGVGAGNDFGHPTARALQLLARSGVSRVLRTDTDGDVAVCLVDGNLATSIRGPTAAGTG